MKIKVKKLHEDALLPVRAKEDDAGADLFFFGEKSILLNPGEIHLFNTGITIEIPKGYVGLLHPRSGLGTKGLTLPNSPGTIDAGYRGEVKVALINLSKISYRINPNDRIAQLLIQKVELVQFDEVEELSESIRGNNGFGSTGTNIANIKFDLENFH